MSSIPSKEELIAQSNSTAPYIKLAGVMWAMALMIIMFVAVTWIVIAIMSGDFYANSKAVRDAAESGSGILSQQGSIAAVEAWLVPLAFVGLAMFIAGFGFAFGNILRNVRLRGNTMAIALPEIKQARRGGSS